MRPLIAIACLLNKQPENLVNLTSPTKLSADQLQKKLYTPPIPCCRGVRVFKNHKARTRMADENGDQTLPAIRLGDDLGDLIRNLVKPLPASWNIKKSRQRFHSSTALRIRFFIRCLKRKSVDFFRLFRGFENLPNAPKKNSRYATHRENHHDPTAGRHGSTSLGISLR